MSADDQAFLDVLNSVPQEVKRFSGDVADYIERHVEKVAASLRETLSSQPWVPEQIRPKAPAKPPTSTNLVSIGFHQRVAQWVLNNKLLTGTFILGITATTIHLVHRSRKAYGRKRRAKRASNGARLEIVVIAGSPSEPIVRSLALDLERRGFIVFIVCNDVEEEIMVQNEARADIRPLSIDISRPNHSIERLASLLQTPQHAFEGARPHHLIFSSLIIIPSLTYPSAPLATIPPSHISDLLNTRLLHPILLTQAFLPLLTAQPVSHSHHHAPSHGPIPKPKILFLTPAIIPSLNPAFHVPESTTTAALTAFTQSLNSELAPLSIPVINLKLGTFDLSSLLSARSQHQSQTLKTQRAEMLSWPHGARETYGSNYLRMMERSDGRGSGRGGSNLRELHNAVFDAMERPNSGWRSGSSIVRVGQGAGLYGFVGNWAPRGLVAWMMGMRIEKVDPWAWTPEGEDLEMGGGELVGMGSEYIDVRGE